MFKLEIVIKLFVTFLPYHKDSINISSKTFETFFIYVSTNFFESNLFSKSN
jgi:hypothetical protein